MSKPANAAPASPAAPIQPDGLVIETDADGFQTCSVKNTAKPPKKMKFTLIEYIKLVKMFVYNFELITKTKKVNLEKLKKIDIFDYNSITSANTDIDKLIDLVTKSNNIIINNYNNCKDNYDDDDGFLNEYEKYTKKIYGYFEKILRNFYTLIRSTATFGSECKNNIISLLGNDCLYQLRRSYQYMIESFGVLVNLFNNLIKNGDESNGKITNLSFDANSALVRKMLIYSSLISKHKYYIFQQNVNDIQDNVTKFFKINEINNKSIKDNIDYYLIPIRNIQFLWRIFQLLTFIFSDKPKHDYSGFYDKIIALKNKMLDEFVIDDVEDKKRQIFIEMNIEFSKVFSKIGSLIPSIKGAQGLPFKKLDAGGLQNMNKIIKGVKGAIQDLTSDNKFINKIDKIDDASLNVDLKLHTLDKTNKYDKFNKYIIEIRNIILSYLKNIVTLLHNIKKIQQDYDQSNHTEFYKFLSNIFYRCLNILILYDHFFKKYLDIFINEDKLIPEFDTSSKTEMNIFGKLIVENYYINGSKYELIDKKTIDDIKKYADIIKITDDIHTILTLGYHLDDSYNETRNGPGSRYEGIVNVLDVFSYSEKITINLSNSFNSFNEKIGILNYYDVLNGYIKSAKAHDTNIEVDIYGVKLFITAEDVTLSFLNPNIQPAQQQNNGNGTGISAPHGKASSSVSSSLSSSNAPQGKASSSLSSSLSSSNAAQSNISSSVPASLSSSNAASNDGVTTPSRVQSNMSQNPQSRQSDAQNIGDFKTKVNELKQTLELLSRKIDKYKKFDNSHSYYTRLHKITDYRNFKTQTDREPQDFIAQIKLKNIGGKQNIGKYNYITEDSLGKAVNNNRARELANNYNQLTDKMIETEKKIGGIQKLALNDLNKSESGYIRMRGGEQQTVNYNNLIKQYQLMAIKQNNIINEIKNIKNGNY